MASRTGKGTANGKKAKPAVAPSRRKPTARAEPTGDNPLLGAWTTPFAMPPFDRIEIAHFIPALDKGFSVNRKEIAAIAGDPAAPTFANTIDALERSGQQLQRVASVFFNLAGTDTNAEIQAIERALAPRFAKHGMRIYQDQTLFARVDALYKKRKRLRLSEEQVRVLERYHRAFVKSGAGLETRAKKRMAAIAARLSVLGTQFSQNLLADEQAFVLVLENEVDLAGLPEAVRAAAMQTAKDNGRPGKHAITLARSSIEPFLQYSARRDLREKAFNAWIMRGANGGKTDNRKIVAEVLALRAERARILGFKSAADSALEFSMAKTPEAVRKLLMDVWAPARKRASEEREALQEAARAEGGNFELAAWDWRYYAERVRKARYDVDEAEIKPYLQLDSMINAAFEVAGKLFGVTFAERTDLPVYHAEVRTFEVKRGGRHVGLFLGDYFARPSKHSGAWMSGWRKQEKLAGDVTPVVVNVMNFAKAAPGQPTLLSIDDARTLFHEFGHALHGLLSNVTYPSVSGTSVERDFVELPSQLYEHWLLRPEVLGRFARHYKTGKPVPAALLKRLEAARNFNQGFKTVEYVAAAIVDLELHVLQAAKGLDVDRFEAKTLAGIDMPREIVMRHRIPHFQHIMGGYASGYYSYLWSEVMDADAFSAFEESGDVFNPRLARRLHDHIYSAGGSHDAAEAYIAFRGRLPETRALLEKRGLSAA
jgi:peptidyl-dipeptidase Dcp